MMPPGTGSKSPFFLSERLMVRMYLPIGGRRQSKAKRTHKSSMSYGDNWSPAECMVQIKTRRLCVS